MNGNYRELEQKRVANWRKLIISVNFIVCLLLCFVEIGMFFQTKLTDNFTTTVSKYIIEYIVYPLSASYIAAFAALFFELIMRKIRSNDTTEKIRNIAPLLANWAILFIISHYHFIFVLTLVSFVIPIILTIFFLERRNTIILCMFSYVGIIHSVLYSNRSSTNAYIHQYMFFNTVIAFVFITIAGVLCIMLINLIKTKNDELENLVYETRKANAAKTNFMKNLSHEVRTPINAIIGMNEIILRSTGDKGVAECANDVDVSANSLLGIIDQMLDMSVIESGKLDIHPEEYSTQQLVYAAVNFVNQRVLIKKLKLEVIVSPDLPKTLWGDDKRILQVLTNVLNNAVKYTDEGFVKLVIDGFKRDEDYVLQIAVSDSGTGIKQENIEHLFNAFDEFDENSNGEDSMAGLGLSICSRILRMMDTSMSVISEVGKGSTFSFKLVQKIVDETPVGEFEYRSPSSDTDRRKYDINIFAPKARVLVVDDNEVNLKVFKGLLYPSAMIIDEALNGNAAIKLCNENHYDIIFLDHLMPGMDGIETLKHIRGDVSSLNKMVPMVMLTANAQAGAREQFIKEGFDDFLSKPVSTEQLVKVINDLIDPNLLEIKPDNFEMATEDDASDVVFPNIQGVYWERGVENCGSKSLLIETVNQFCDSMEDEIDYLDKTVSYDRDKYRIKVHSIKSVAATVGCDNISVLARLLEFAARDGKVDVIDRLHAVLVSEMRSYRENVKVLKPVEDKTESANTDVIAIELNGIKSAMIEFDTDLADAAMERINQYTYEDKIQAYVNKLTHAVESLDADVAVEICDELIEMLFKTKK